MTDKINHVVVDGDGTLSSTDGWRWLNYVPGDATVALDGDFTAEDLEWLAARMRLTPPKA